MAAPTRRKHGHVAGLRRRPFNPAPVDKPSGLIEELDEDEVSAESVEGVDTDTERTVDVVQDVEEDSAADVAVSEPAEAETQVEQVAEAEAAPADTVEIELTEPVAVDDQPEQAPAEAESVEEDAAEQLKAATDTDGAAEDDEESSGPDRHADLFAWLAGDGESLAGLLGSAKQPETYAPAGHAPPRPAPRPLARPPRLDRQSFRRATDAPRPAAPLSGPTPPPPPRTSSPPAKPNRRRRSVILVAAIVVAVALVAGVVALLLPGSGSDNGAAGPGSATAPIAPPAQAVQPVAWAKQNLPSGAAIVAPVALVPGLQAAGFVTVYADDTLTGLTLANVAYLVGEPTVTPPAADLERFVNASAPLAYFGTGSAQTMVRVVFAGGTSAMAKAMVADTKLRAQEGSELLNNPNVHTDVAMRKVLANGLLDARAGALVGALAGAGQVTLTDPVRAASEAAAGLPYRTFTVSMPNTVFLDNSVHRADPKYKPASIVAVGPKERRLIWTPAVAPDTPFS